MSTTTTATGSATIEAVENMPAITISRDFAATPAQLVKAHTDPELFVQWVGPDGMTMTIDHWDARTGGSWRYVDHSDGEDFGFHGSFHEVRDDRLVQTFTFEGFPDSVALETMTFEDLGDGRTRLHVQSLVRQLRGPRRDAVERHGRRPQRRLPQARRPDRRRHRLTHSALRHTNRGLEATIRMTHRRVGTACLAGSHGPTDQLRHPCRRRPRPDPGVLRRRARLDTGARSCPERC